MQGKFFNKRGKDYFGRKRVLCNHTEMASKRSGHCEKEAEDNEEKNVISRDEEIALKFV